MTLFFLTLLVFAVAMLIMSVGVIFSGRCLRGSCGGAELLDADGEPMSCATCPKRKKRRDEAARTNVDPALTSIGIGASDSGPAS